MKFPGEVERFLKYVKIDTQSSEESKGCPSTEKQRVFAAMLAEEMRSIGIQNVRISENAFVFGCLPASPGYEECPVLGLIAHMDTALEALGGCLHPGMVEKYDGSVIPLGQSGKTLDPVLFPELLKFKGHTLITTDGTTLLGADDKAGIAEIMTAAEKLAASEEPHGKICFGFTPDEVKEMASYYGVPEKYDEICQWYDGYRFGKSEIFNPWSVINYFNSGCEPKAFWLSTGSNEIIGEIIAQADQDIYKKLTSLVSGKTIVSYIDTSVIYPQIKQNPSAMR